MTQRIEYGDDMIQNKNECRDGGPGMMPATPKACGRTRVLVAEDDDQLRRFLVKVLSAHEYAPVECHDGFELFQHLQPFAEHGAVPDFDAIISDILMPGPTGLEILEDLHDRPGFPPMILITGYGDAGVYERARKAGAFAVLDKPFGIGELLGKLHEIPPSPCRSSMNGK